MVVLSFEQFAFKACSLNHQTMLPTFYVAKNSLFVAFTKNPSSLPKSFQYVLVLNTSKAVYGACLYYQ